MIFFFALTFMFKQGAQRKTSSTTAIPCDFSEYTNPIVYVNGYGDDKYGDKTLAASVFFLLEKKEEVADGRRRC